MSDPYSEMEDIWARYRGGDRSNMASNIVALLARQGIRLRRNDGELRQVTVSKPKSVPHGLVVGLRYVKRDGTYTEDHFTIEVGQETIDPNYRGTLEHKWPEYRGTHKEQVIFPLGEDDVKAPPTEVNTLTWGNTIRPMNGT